MIQKSCNGPEKSDGLEKNQTSGGDSRMKRIVTLLIAFLFAFGLPTIAFSQESPASEMKS